MSSPNRFEVLARKAASMYTDSQLALRNNVVPLRTSPVRDEAHATNHSGAEPSSVSHPHPSSSAQSAGFGSPVPLPLYSRMKPSGHTGVENGATIPHQQHHPQQQVLMTSAHALARYHISKSPLFNTYHRFPAFFCTDQCCTNQTTKC